MRGAQRLKRSIRDSAVEAEPSCDDHTSILRKIVTERDHLTNSRIFVFRIHSLPLTDGTRVAKTEADLVATARKASTWEWVVLQSSGGGGRPCRPCDMGAIINPSIYINFPPSRF